MSSQRIGVVVAVFISTWILASHTIGDAFDSGNGMTVGFAVALLAGATGLVIAPSHHAGSSVSITMIVCGTLCMIAAISLQFYLSSVTAQQSKDLLEALRETLGSQKRANFNVNAAYPGSVQGISYISALFGIWLASMGAASGFLSPSTSDDLSGNVSVDPSPSFDRE